MYKNEFDNLFKNKTKFKAYLFYGQSNFLIENYAAMVAATHGEHDEIEKVYFDDYNFKYVKDKLLQSSLFSSNNIILIKLTKKLGKKEVVELISAANSNPDSTLIFACLGDSDFKTMGGYFSAKLNATSVRMFTPFPNEAIKLLEQKARKLNINIEISALNHLYFMHRNDLSLCMNDLNKLSILDEPISAKVVEKHCFGIGTVSLEDFLHNLISGASISKDLYFLLEEGINEVFLTTQITAFVQQLFMISAYARTIGAPNAKEILGFSPPKPIWEKKTRLAISIKPEQFLEMFEFLNRLELELKSSKINDSNSYIQASLRKFSVLFG